MTSRTCAYGSKLINTMNSSHALVPPTGTHGHDRLGKLFQEIVKDPAHEFPRTVLAAGAVLWRRSDAGTVEYACIHRPHYDDWSLAKGKLDPNENLIMTAAREITEETGYQIQLQRLLGHVYYPIHDRTKVVYYWLAKVTGGEFISNNEVDEIRWLPIQDALELLTYEVDHAVLATADMAVQQNVTSRIVLIRHARAKQRATWLGDDKKRPLDRKGLRQVELLTETLPPFHATTVSSTPIPRCTRTAEPLAAMIGVPLVEDPALESGCLKTNPTACIEHILAHRQVPGTHIVVAEGPVVKAVIEHLAQQTDHVLEATSTKKGSIWMLSFANETFVGADYYASVLPVK